MTANLGSEIKDIGKTEAFDDQKFWRYMAGDQSQKKVNLVLESTHGAETLKIGTQG